MSAMTTTEAIIQHLKSLPEPAKAEVLRFIEFLQARAHPSYSLAGYLHG